MSFDVDIWRRSPTTKTAMVAEVQELLSVDDQDHPAVAMFDTREFIAAVVAQYGSSGSDDDMTWVDLPGADGELTSIALFEWTGKTSALVSASGPMDMLDATVEALLPFAMDRDLLLLNATDETVWNNRRSYS